MLFCSFGYKLYKLVYLKFVDNVKIIIKPQPHYCPVYKKQINDVRGD